jgi:hypothetical protein
VPARPVLLAWNQSCWVWSAAALPLLRLLVLVVQQQVTQYSPDSEVPRQRARCRTMPRQQRLRFQRQAAWGWRPVPLLARLAAPQFLSLRFQRSVPRQRLSWSSLRQERLLARRS